MQIYLYAHIHIDFTTTPLRMVEKTEPSIPHLLHPTLKKFFKLIETETVLAAASQNKDIDTRAPCP